MEGYNVKYFEWLRLNSTETKVSFSHHSFSISFQHSYFHLLEDALLALFTLTYELPVWLSKVSSSPSKADGNSNLKRYIL